MARTIDEIMATLLAAKEAQAGLAVLNSRSVTAVWRLLLYVVAVGCHVVEVLVDAHIQEVEEQLAQKLPHRAKWYCDKTRQFMSDKALMRDMDIYDISKMSDDEIDAAKVVKHAVAVEDGKTSMLTIKVAGEDNDGERQPLTAEQLRQLTAYIGEVKDAGVRIYIVNKPADLFSCTMDVHYDAMREGEHVKTACEVAVKEYIQNLPFNGIYTNMALTDKLQEVSGVKIVELAESSAKEDGVASATPINARYTPVAGYMKIDVINIRTTAYER